MGPRPTMRRGAGGGAMRGVPTVSLESTILRQSNKFRMTTKRRPQGSAGEGAAQVHQDQRDAYTAALLCSLFPLADSGDPGKALGGPPQPSNDSGQQQQQGPQLQHGAGGVFSGLLHSHGASAPHAQSENSTISGDRVFLAPKTVTEYRSRLSQKALMMKSIPDQKLQLFVKSATKFDEQTATFQPAQLSDVQVLITLTATYIEKEVKNYQPPLQPDECDTMFIAVLELYLTSIREALNKESNPRAILQHPLLKDVEAFKAIFSSKFLQGTKSIQGSAKTPLADWLRVIFDMSIDEHNATIINVKKNCSEKSSFNDLERYIRELEMKNVQTTPQSDWSAIEPYENWRQRELGIMKGFKNAYLARFPNARAFEENVKHFLPPKRALYYKILLKRCLDHDMGSVKRDDKKDDSDLSKASKMLLAECGTRWQLSKDYRDLALMEVYIGYLVDGSKNMNEMLTKINPLFTLMKNIQAVRNSDIAFHLSILKRLDKCIQQSVSNFLELLKGEPAHSRLTMNNLADTLQRINQDTAFQMYGDGLLENVTEKLTLIMKEVLVGRSRTMSEALDSDEDIGVMIMLVKTMTTDIERLKHHFPDTLLGSVNIARIAEETYMKNFFLLGMETLKMRFATMKDMSIDDVLGPHGLYHEVTLLYTKLEPETLQSLNFNAEEYFRPFITEWLGRTDDKWKEWVDNACKIEMYKPLLSPTTMYSGSVRDIFTFFNNGLRFMKKLKTISTAKKEEMILLFIRTMCKSLENYTNTCIAEFVKMENENSDVAIDFTYESCIKLNNMIGSSLQLQFILDDLGVADRGGKINPNAKRTDIEPDASVFEVTIVRAYDLQICDFDSSDPYTVIKFGGEILEKTNTIYKNLNPVWNKQFDVTLPHVMDSKDTFLDLQVFDEDTVGGDEICGVSNSQLYLRDSKYNDFLSHDEVFQLRPQGKLIIRVQRLGEIDDIDFWVMKSEQTIDFTAERMVRIYADRIVRFVSSEWNKIVLSFTQSSFFGKASPPPTDETIETAMSSIFSYLDRTLSLFNESLDRPRLNAFLRRAYPHLFTLGLGESDELDGSDLSPEEKALQKKRLERAREEQELDGSSLICLVVWHEIVLKIRESIGGLGVVAAERKTRVNAGGTGPLRKPLSDMERRKLNVLEAVLEYIKAFFYSDVDGRHYGFSLDELEMKSYLETRDLITKVNI